MFVQTVCSKFYIENKNFCYKFLNTYLRLDWGSFKTTNQTFKKEDYFFSFLVYASYIEPIKPLSLIAYIS